MRLFRQLATVATLAALAACGDSTTPRALPTGPAAPADAAQATAPGTCTSLAGLNALARSVFGSGGPNVSSALGRISNVDKQLQKGNLATAQSHATSLVDFIQKKAASGSLQGTRAQVQALISGILCYAGLLPNTTLIYPSDQPQVITETSAKAGVSLQGNTVGEPTLITIQLLDPAAASPLLTKLDKYPSYVQISASSPLTKPAIVGVCPSAGIPTDVRARLRLGHQSSGGFVITPPADASFLDCSGVAASQMPAWLQALASLVLPRSLHAATFFGGGVGGVATEFSPFGPVDTELSFAGGVGGTSTEFLRVPSAPPVTRPAGSGSSTSVPAVMLSIQSNLACASVEAPAGAPLPSECRPVVTLATNNGTILQNVPVSWRVTAGGGGIAALSLQTSACGATYASTASASTDVNGKAGVCWTMGTTPGTNTIVATPSAGGDAPNGVTFVAPTVTFTATATAITPIATATGSSVQYDALPKVGSGSCSHGLVPALSYSSGSAPVAAGSHTVTVTCGGAGFTTVTASAPIVISRRQATATAGSATAVIGSTPPVMPCVVSGLLAPDAGAVTCTTALPPVPAAGDNVTAAVISPANPQNYAIQSVGGVFSLRYAKESCFAPPITATASSDPAWQTKGHSVVLRCTLKNALGAVVTQASGSLVVVDKGPTGFAPGATVLSLANAFALHGGIYVHTIDTSPLAYQAGHYYLVTASWSDGTSTSGYFYLRY